MLLERGQAESRTACAILVAMDEHEITIDEFADAIELLTPEALQVIATALRGCTVLDPRAAAHLQRARTMCARLAAANRMLC